jgi:methylthioribose-1-phosphate isomerase
MLEENPLTVGAPGVGVGAAIGLAIPETSREHEVVGEARDTVVEKAQEKAQQRCRRASSGSTKRPRAQPSRKPRTRA